MKCKRMASSTNGAKYNIDTSPYYQKYFIGVAACIIFGSFGHSSSESIHESSKKNYPFEFNGSNLIFASLFLNEPNNNAKCYFCRNLVNGNSHLGPLNYGETVESTSLTSYENGPTNNYSQLIKNNCSIYNEITSQREQENFFVQDIMRRVKKNDVETDAASFHYGDVKLLSNNLSNVFPNNQTRQFKSSHKLIKRSLRNSNNNAGDLIYMKDPLHSPQIIDNVNSSDRSFDVNLRSNYSSKNLNKRFVGIQSSGDVDVVINPEYEEKKLKKITHNEASHEYQINSIAEKYNNDSEYLDEYESDIESNEMLSFVNSSNNVEVNEINRNESSGRPHKKKGVKKIKQLKIKNSTKNDNKISPKMQNLLHDIANELLLTNPDGYPTADSSKLGIMKRDQVNKLNSSEMLSLIKLFVDRELSEYNKEQNGNNENSLDSHHSDEQEFAFHTADLSNLSQQEWNDNDRTTIPINFNIYFFNNNDGSETTPLYNRDIMPYIPTVPFNDIPNAIIRPEDDYKTLLKYGDLPKYDALKPPNIPSRSDKKGNVQQLKCNDAERSGNKNEVCLRTGEGGGDGAGGEEGKEKCPTEKLVLMILGSVSGVLLLGILLCVCWKMCHKEAVQICNEPNPCC